MVTSNPITLFYTPDEKYLWGSSWTTIFKVARTKTSLAVVDYVPKSVETIMEDKFHGAYSLLTQEVRSEFPMSIKHRIIVGSYEQLASYNKLWLSPAKAKGWAAPTLRRRWPS